MRKILFILTMILTMIIHQMCFAYDGDDLDRAQKKAQNFINMMENKAEIPYTVISKDFNTSLRVKIDETSYKILQKEIRDNMGVLNEYRFYAYQRYDKNDRLIYIGNFSKSNWTMITLFFDKKQKMTDFVITPLDKKTIDELSK